MQTQARHRTRRRFLLSVVAPAFFICATTALSEDEIFIISRERVLREIQAAQVLLEAEREMTTSLQAMIDDTGAALSAEEVELARIRNDLTPGEFEARANDFDRRRRLARSVAQERAQLLQKGFQEARGVILESLPGIIERVREEAGARIILDTDQVVAAASGIDLTDRVIEVYNADGPRPAVPEIDLSAPMLEPAPPLDFGDSEEPE